MRNKFGWSYPPGCSGPPDEDCQCQICGHEAGDCICPECPKCGEQGNLECYKKHGLSLNNKQLIAQSKMKIADLEEQIGEEQRYIIWLEEQADDNFKFSP